DHMRRGVMLAGLAVALLLVALWLGGGFTALRLWAEEATRAVQRDMAGAVRAIAQGAPGAVFGLLSVCFVYGFCHAAGPGHGKMLIGGYGMARRVALGRLVGLAFAASLAQATVAVALVYGLLLGFGWARGQVEGLNDQLLAPLSHAMIAGLGLWLVLRGWRGLRRGRRVEDHGHHHDHGHGHHHHDHHHEHGDGCGCGHAHGPTPEQAAQVTGWRDAAVLVAGIALRPCSGALFLLIVSWQMGIATAGIAGTYAMGLGTAFVTVAVAAISVSLREGALAALPGRQLARAMPVFELAVGAIVAIVAIQLMVAAL
ncbi:MAG: nickel/cobalt transporter, partial [Gemmobacter sp.]